MQKRNGTQRIKKIFYVPLQLVLGFDRGNDFENKIKINYPEKLDLSEVPKEKEISPKKFDLIGVIKRCDIGAKEHYISLILNSNGNSWYLFDNEKMAKLGHLFDHKDEDVLMLFYVAP